MTSALRSTLDFLLYDWLQADALAARERFADHSRETFDAVLDTCERIARERYAPFNRTVDIEEPRTEPDGAGGLRVVLPQCTHDARLAYAGSGMLAAAQDYALGGMQLPYLVEAVANTFFGVASVRAATVAGATAAIWAASRLARAAVDRLGRSEPSAATLAGVSASICVAVRPAT